MHKFNNIGNNFEGLAYKHDLEYSIKGYGHFFWMCEKHNMGTFSAYLVGTYCR